MKKELIKSIIEWSVRAWETAVALLFPRRCPVCDDIVTPFAEKICSPCMRKLKLITPPFCMKCGKKVEEGEEYCEDCKCYRHLFVRGRALYDYGSVAGSLYRFKYGKRKEYADFFGEEMATYLRTYIDDTGAEALIPVPLHYKRRCARGYNQAQELARVLGRHIGLPVYGKYLERVRATKPLKHLSPRERQNNLKKAFIIRQNDVKLKVVLLVDDIYTTGSTVNEIAKVLLEAGVEKVYFLTLSCGASL